VIALCTHQPLDAVQAPIDTFRQDNSPDAPGAMGVVRADEPRPRLRTDLHGVPMI
jgi:hypothetical protein